MLRKLQFAVLLPVLYTLLFAGSMVALVFSYHASWGIFAILLTLPWCVALAALHIVRSQVAGMLGLCICAAVNLCILFYLGELIDHIRRRLQ